MARLGEATVTLRAETVDGPATVELAQGQTAVIVRAVLPENLAKEPAAS